MEVTQEKDYLVDVILHGAPFEDSRHLQLLYETIKESEAQHQSNSSMSLTCGPPNDADESFELRQLTRISEMKRHFRWFPVPNEYHTRFQKCPDISTQLRERGNRILQDSSYSHSSMPSSELRQALRAFNLSIAFAPPNSAQLALALEKRAFVLLLLNHPDLAQHDIHAVAGNTAYPLKSLQSAKKLIDLQSKCTTLSHCLKYSKKSREASPMMCERRREKLFVDTHFYQLQTRNPEVENVTDFCVIDYRPQCGRKIVVTRDVEPGEVIMVDEPFSIVLERILNWDVEHCSNCSRPVVSGLPCDCCTFAWYCSAACKIEGSRSNHKYEHYLSYLKCSRIMSLKGLLAARLVFKVGPDQLYRIFQTKDPEYFQQPESIQRRGYCSDGVYKARSYLPIFHLVSHPHHDQSMAKSNTFKALIMTHLIDETSDFFFKFRYNEDYESFKDFIASLILRHIEAVEFNAITLSQLNADEDMTVESSSNSKLPRTLRYGAGVYPLLCLINHSCDPSALPLRSLKLLKTSVIAIKSLKAGEEVTISYAPHFSTVDYNERQQYLWERYNFRCQCEACMSAWSPCSANNYIPESQCNSCGRYLREGQCPRCFLKDIQIKESFPTYQGMVKEIDSMIEKEEYLTALEAVKGCLQFCYENLPSTSILGLQFQELFKLVLVQLVNLQ